jgi:hypothetical protein
MLRTVLELMLAPALVAAATIVCRWWGPRAGGVVSAFPAVVGPMLLITAQERGAAFAGRAAEGTLVGLVALAGFILCYGRTARRAAWPLSLAAGWAAAAVLGAVVAVSARRLPLAGSLAASSGSLLLAYHALPATDGLLAAGLQPRLPGPDLAIRMALTALLIVLLTVAAELRGPLIGGVLAALPVLASVLAVFTHRGHGADEAIVLLRGMAAGMAGFIGFCAAIALLIVPAGTATAFAAASLTAAAAQVGLGVRAWSSGGRYSTLGARRGALLRALRP